MRVLIVDDDPAVRASISRALRLDGYDVRAASNGLDALDALQLEPIDVVVLDVQMPVMDGLAACAELRRRGDRTPVLMLTARTAVDDRIEGLDAGADDYLVKPFALGELKARLRALLRRAADDGGAPSVLRFADLTLNLATRRAGRGERRVDDLTRTEFALLELLMRNPDIVLTRSVIFEHVWGYDFGASSNSLDVYIGYLRRKTEAGGELRLIHTVRGVGYVLRSDP
ncbi:MAG: response regulator transcription factor [Actinobacteria bacterium]|nr:response regulator transcription factor [Actinomycetota bacterium]